MDAFFSLLDEQVVWQSHYSQKIPLNGKFEKFEGIQRLLQIFDATLEFKLFEPLSFLENQNTVVVLGREEAIAKATGKPYVNNWVHVFTFNNEKVLSVDSFNTVETVEAAF